MFPSSGARGECGSVGRGSAPAEGKRSKPIAGRLGGENDSMEDLLEVSRSCVGGTASSRRNIVGETSDERGETGGAARTGKQGESGQRGRGRGDGSPTPSFRVEGLERVGCLPVRGVDHS